MEQILTTAALIAGGVFAVWILFADPGGEDGKGEVNTALLGALLMIPVIILLIIGIVLFLPVLLGIALLIFLVYAAYRAVRWFLTRERKEKPQRFEEGGVCKPVRRAVERISRSRPVHALRDVTVRTRRVIADTGRSLKERTKRTAKRMSDEGPKRFRETVRRIRSSKPSRKKISESVREVFRQGKERVTRAQESFREHIVDRSQREKHEPPLSVRDDRMEKAPDQSKKREWRADVYANRSQGFSMRERWSRWRSALIRMPAQSIADGKKDSRQDRSNHALSKRVSRKRTASDRSHAHDSLQNMRKIGWSTRKHLGEVYHHRRKGDAR